MPTGFNKCEFVNIVYNSLDDTNWKDKLMEFDVIFQNHKNLVIEASGIDFIKAKIEKNMSEVRRFFLILLLGIHEEKIKKFQSYPPDFQSQILLDSIDKIQENTFPPKFHQFALKGIMGLLYNIKDRNPLSWLNVFPVANILDKKYSFLDRFSNLKYDSNTMKKLFEDLPELVKPYIDDG